MTIEWYENGLKNRKIHLENEKKRLEEMKASILRQEEDIAFLTLQIETAKAKGKDSFDDERFLKKKD